MPSQLRGKYGKPHLGDESTMPSQLVRIQVVVPLAIMRSTFRRLWESPAVGRRCAPIAIKNTKWKFLARATKRASCCMALGAEREKSASAPRSPCFGSFNNYTAQDHSTSVHDKRDKVAQIYADIHVHGILGNPRAVNAAWQTAGHRCMILFLDALLNLPTNNTGTKVKVA
jgi:hypothetical protein